jgi:predicted RNA binding protein YcfA (HicA-like mRNA interferase family)
VAGRLPVLSGRDVVRAFERAGWAVNRQTGSHICMVKSGADTTLAVPAHREVAKGTLHGLIRTAGMTVAEFLQNV